MKKIVQETNKQTPTQQYTFHFFQTKKCLKNVPTILVFNGSTFLINFCVIDTLLLSSQSKFGLIQQQQQKIKPTTTSTATKNKCNLFNRLSLSNSKQNSLRQRERLWVLQVSSFNLYTLSLFLFKKTFDLCKHSF